MATRRLFLLSLASLVGVAACAPAEEPHHGLRGTGSVLRPRQPDDVVFSAPAPAAPTPEPTVGPSVIRLSNPIVPPEAVPTRSAAWGGTEAQARLFDVPGGGRAPLSLPLPAKRVSIPTLALDAAVLPIGTRLTPTGDLVWETAAFAVGHHRGTAGPGQVGNMVLSGHISSPGEGAVFARLPEVKQGDAIIVGTEEKQYLYQVLETRTVLPQDVSVMGNTGDPVLTLITCVPDRVYSHRLIVKARLATA